MTVLKYRPYQAKTILNKLEEKDEHYLCMYTLNPYRGCEHGCLYCYVQSEKYTPYKKPGNREEFFRRIEVKTNAPFLLQKELAKIKEPSIICVGSACDPYQPAEKKHRLTHRILEILLDFSMPVHILTKSDTVLEDIDLLKAIDKKSAAIVSFSVITLNSKLVATFEPDSPNPKKRFAALKKLRREGIISGISMMPILPYLTEPSSIASVVKHARAAGASYLISGDLTLRDQQRERFFSVLEHRFPKYIHRYKALYEDNPSPAYTYTKRVREELNVLCRKYKIPTGIPLPQERLPRYPKQGRLI